VTLTLSLPQKSTPFCDEYTRDVLALNQRVQGSSPCAPTKKIKGLRQDHRPKSSQKLRLGRLWEDKKSRSSLRSGGILECTDHKRRAFAYFWPKLYCCPLPSPCTPAPSCASTSSSRSGSLPARSPGRSACFRTPCGGFDRAMNPPGSTSPRADETFWGPSPARGPPARAAKGETAMGLLINGQWRDQCTIPPAPEDVSCARIA
jgi:hypothetical protein